VPIARGATWVVPPGHGLFIPQAARHTVTTPADAVIRTVNLYPGTIDRFGAEAELIALSDVLKVLLERAATYDETYDVSGRQGHVIQVLLDELQSAKGADFQLPLGRDKRVRRITEAVLEDPSSNHTLEAWAKKVGASPRNLTRLFANDIGISFKSYRRLAQIQSALLLIAKGETVSEVAVKVGYESLSAFIYAFRRVTGTTPGRSTTQDGRDKRTNCETIG
jgi:AraC-like DNA-binding protein